MITYSIYKLCRDTDERAQGMQNDMLDEFDCCVFVFDGRVQPRFWGKNTLQDMYVSLIDSGTVVECMKICAFDTVPVVMTRFGDIAIETLDELEVGAKVVFTGDTVAVF